MHIHREMIKTILKDSASFIIDKRRENECRDVALGSLLGFGQRIIKFGRCLIGESSRLGTFPTMQIPQIAGKSHAKPL
jgi:hypothetical protein